MITEKVNKAAEVAKLDAFLLELAALCEKHGVGIYDACEAGIEVSVFDGTFPDDGVCVSYLISGAPVDIREDRAELEFTVSAKCPGCNGGGGQEIREVGGGEYVRWCWRCKQPFLSISTMDVPT